MLARGARQKEALLAPEDVHGLILGTRGHLRSRSRGAFRLLMKLRLLISWTSDRSLPGIIEEGPTQSHGSLKVEEGTGEESKGKAPKAAPPASRTGPQPRSTEGTEAGREAPH